MKETACHCQKSQFVCKTSILETLCISSTYLLFTTYLVDGKSRKYLDKNENENLNNWGRTFFLREIVSLQNICDHKSASWWNCVKQCGELRKRERGSAGSLIISPKFTVSFEPQMKWISRSRTTKIYFKYVSDVRYDAKEFTIYHNSW